MNDKREILTVEQALAMLPDGEYVHTFRNPGVNMMLGADWGRSELVKTIESCGGRLELAGPMATRLGHGLVVWTSEDNPLYVATSTRKMLSK